MATTLSDTFEDPLVANWVYPTGIGTMYANALGKPVSWWDTDGGFAWAADSDAGGTSIDDGGGFYTITLASVHNYTVGDTFVVTITGSVSSALDGTYVATATATDKFQIDASSAGKAVGATGVVKYPKYLSDANHLMDALIFSVGESANHKHVLWSRIKRTDDPFTEGPLNLDFGYGCSLSWNADGTRLLEFVKVTRIGTLETLASRTVTLRKQNDGSSDTDLGVLQRLRFMVVDKERNNTLPEQDGVVLRAFLNNDDLGLPTLEFNDVGISQSPGTDYAPPWRDAGSWMISFGAADETFYDSVSFTDSYVVPDYGVYGKKSRTLAELRTAVTRKLTIGGNVGYDDVLIDDAINEAILEAKSELGDKALFWMRMQNFTLTADSQKLVPLPDDVDRVIEIYDVDLNGSKVGWSFVLDDEQGRPRVEIYSNPSGRAYTVQYIASFSPLVNDGDFCPIPREHDEVVVIGAALRIGGETELNSKSYQVWSVRWRKAMNDLQKMMSRKTQSQHPAMRIHWRRPRSRTFPSPNSYYWYP